MGGLCSCLDHPLDVYLNKFRKYLTYQTIKLVQVRRRRAVANEAPRRAARANRAGDGGGPLRGWATVFERTARHRWRIVLRP